MLLYTARASMPLACDHSAKRGFATFTISRCSIATHPWVEYWSFNHTQAGLSIRWCSFPHMDVPQGTFSCALHNSPCAAADKTAGSHLDGPTARRVRSKDAPNQYHEAVSVGGHAPPCGPWTGCQNQSFDFVSMVKTMLFAMRKRTGTRMCLPVSKKTCEVAL